jgi:hypothetical protein
MDAGARGRKDGKAMGGGVLVGAWGSIMETATRRKALWRRVDAW